MPNKPKDAVLYDGSYFLTVEFTTEVDPDGGKFLSPYEDQPGRILINPNQPRFDMDVALNHEINHYIAWVLDWKQWGHARIDAHALRSVCLLKNSPWLAKHWYARYGK